MYGLVLWADGKVFAAVSPRKRALNEWALSVKEFQECPAPLCAWRERDKTGWSDGSPDSWRHIQNFPHEAVVIW